MVNKKSKLNELTDSVISELNKMQYCNSYIRGMRYTYNCLCKYCDEHNVKKFTILVGQNFLKKQYNIQPGTYSKKYSREHRAIEMLTDYIHFGVVMLKRKKERNFPKAFKSICECYLDHMQKSYKRKNTILSHQKSLYKLTNFLDSKNIKSIKNIKYDVLSDYVSYLLSIYSNDVVRLHIGIMKHFIKYISDNYIEMHSILSKLNSIVVSHQHKELPQTLTLEEINKIISFIDKDSPQGKRDYAILLLAFRLGLRSSDIRSLKPSNFDWNKHTISFTQTKTGELLTLPIPNDVGWAVIDYLKNGRHSTDTEEIFVRMIAPYIPLQNLDNVLIRYMSKANINVKSIKHHGLHMLRHSLATHMLDNNIPITSIQSILGHVREDTTQKYIGINAKQLYQCALEVVL